MVTKLSDLLQSRKEIKEPLVKNTLRYIETKQTYHKSATMPFNKQAVLALDENFQMKYFAFFHFNEVQVEGPPPQKKIIIMCTARYSHGLYKSNTPYQ